MFQRRPRVSNLLRLIVLLVMPGLAQPAFAQSPEEGPRPRSPAIGFSINLPGLFGFAAELPIAANLSLRGWLRGFVDVSPGGGGIIYKLVGREASLNLGAEVSRVRCLELDPDGPGCSDTLNPYWGWSPTLGVEISLNERHTRTVEVSVARWFPFDGGEDPVNSVGVLFRFHLW